MEKQKSKIKRCAWAEANEFFFDYHDSEWGVPEHRDQKLFEMLNLEGAQAGLSWLTILKKRVNYQEAFNHFDAEKIAHYGDKKKSALMQNSGIVRNRLKISATVDNAKAYLKVQKEFGSFNAYLWAFVKNKPLRGPGNAEALQIGIIMSKELKKRGFRFVGPTICYAFMQAIGMVNDHDLQCHQSKKR